MNGILACSCHGEALTTAARPCADALYDDDEAGDRSDGACIACAWLVINEFGWLATYGFYMLD